MSDAVQLFGGIGVKLVIVFLVLWVAYKAVMKALVFLRALTRPVRRTVRATLDPLERRAANHVASALEEAGLRRAAKATRELPDVAASAEAAIGRHLDGHSAPKK